MVQNDHGEMFRVLRTVCGTEFVNADCQKLWYYSRENCSLLFRTKWEMRTIVKAERCMLIAK